MMNHSLPSLLFEGDAEVHSIRFSGGSNNFDTRHHTVILVFEIVTMEQVTPTITAPPYDDVDFLAVVDGDSVLPSTLMAERRAAIPVENLKRREVGVDRM